MPIPPLSLTSAAGPATSGVGGDFVVTGGSGQQTQQTWMWLAIAAAVAIIVALLMRR